MRILKHRKGMQTHTKKTYWHVKPSPVWWSLHSLEERTVIVSLFTLLKISWLFELSLEADSVEKDQWGYHWLVAPHAGTVPSGHRGRTFFFNISQGMRVFCINRVYSYIPMEAERGVACVFNNNASAESTGSLARQRQNIWWVLGEVAYISLIILCLEQRPIPWCVLWQNKPGPSMRGDICKWCSGLVSGLFIKQAFVSGVETCPMCSGHRVWILIYVLIQTMVGESHHVSQPHKISHCK